MGPRTFQQGERLTQTLISIASEGEAALRALTPPAAVAAPFRRYLASRAEALALLRAAQRAAIREDAQAYVDARDALSSGGAKRRKLARAAGLRVCAGGEGR